MVQKCERGWQTLIDTVYLLLEKLGYPHPLHPPLTHMPLGLVTGALVLGFTA
jgi:uncharacterized membrane protein